MTQLYTVEGEPFRPRPGRWVVGTTTQCDGCGVVTGLSAQKAMLLGDEHDARECRLMQWTQRCAPDHCSYGADVCWLDALGLPYVPFPYHIDEHGRMVAAHRALHSAPHWTCIIVEEVAALDSGLFRVDDPLDLLAAHPHVVPAVRALLADPVALQLVRSHPGTLSKLLRPNV